MQRVARELRIVGGALRGRKWRFPETPGLRPTPDRVRETLFNWLAPHIAGMRVLDAFAGSGALGFEALSRGAASAVLLEQDRAAAANLRATAARFGLAAARVEGGDALAFLRAAPARGYDLVFLDPPFAAGLAEPALAAIAAGGLLAPGGFCYLEQPAAQGPPALPAGWILHRSGKAGDVGYHLLHAAPRDLSRDL
ncbi:MAG TPA: 16S rRNA (guanine(966)-N(2))-methyltransferase RsmD [Steroidobacteraceae bacterium]|nr:16S rRNA (guanine(966)-N(2))-methyltransferase RsmD [Steroidobacteraceae bacterium]